MWIAFIIILNFSSFIDSDILANWQFYCKLNPSKKLPSFFFSQKLVELIYQQKSASLQNLIFNFSILTLSHHFPLKSISFSLSLSLSHSIIASISPSLWLSLSLSLCVSLFFILPFLLSISLSIYMVIFFSFCVSLSLPFPLSIS